MKSTVFASTLSLFLFFPQIVKSQESNYLFKRLNANTTIAFIPKGDSDIGLKYNEFTWTVQASASLTNSIYLGFQASAIFTSGNTITNSRYNTYGVFVQYDFIPEKKLRIFVESSYSIGNYCTCGLKSEDFYERNVSYFGIGGGVDYPLLNSGFFISFSTIFHHIIPDIEDKTSYNFYRLGLGYSFGKE